MSGANDRVAQQNAASGQSAAAAASKKEQKYHVGSRACRGTGLFRHGHIHFNYKSSYYCKNAERFSSQPQPVNTRRQITVDAAC